MGRGAISPVLLAVVTVLQMLEKAPDRQAAEWVVSRIERTDSTHLLAVVEHLANSEG